MSDRELRRALRLIANGGLAGVSTGEIVDLRAACERALADRTSNLSLKEFVEGLTQPFRSKLIRVYGRGGDFDEMRLTELLRDSPLDLICELGVGEKTIEAVHAHLIKSGVILSETEWNRTGLAQALLQYRGQLRW